MNARWGVLFAAALLGGCKASFNPDAPLAYPCNRDGGARADAGPDPECPGAWVCGLDGRCHDPKVGAPYLCSLDSDCALAWRCGADGRCVGNLEDEALRAGLGPLDAGRAFAWPLSSVPDKFAVGELVGVGPNNLVQPFGYLRGTLLTVGYQVGTLSDSSYATGEPLRVLDVGPGVTDFGLLSDTLVLQRAGGLETFHFFTDGGVAGPLSADSGFGDQLRITRGANPVVVSFTADTYWLDGPSVAQPVRGARAVPRPDGGARAIRDVVDVSTRACASKVVLASDELLFYLPRDSSGQFLDAGAGQPVIGVLDLKTLPTLAAAGFEAQALRSPGDGLLAMASAPPDAGQPLLVLLEVADVPDAGCEQVDVAARLGPYPLCSSGDSVVDFLPLRGGATPQVIVRCRNGGSERTVLLSVPVGGQANRVDTRPISDDSSLFADTLLASRSSPGTAGYAGGHGQLWVGSAAWPPVPIAPDRPPQYVVRQFLPPSGAGPAYSAPFFGQASGGWLSRSETSLPVYFQYRPGDARAVAAIAGQPGWAIMESGLVVNLESRALVAAPQAASPNFAGPYLAAVTQTAGGGRQLVVGSGDALYGADVAGKVGELEWKLVPLSGANLRSMVVVPGQAHGDAGVPLFEGYVLAQSHLFALTAVSAQRWQAQELTLPADGEAEKVWADGARGRVAFEDGRVFSLPGRVLVAPMLPEKYASDFAQVCGQGYALSAGGLYRLDRAADGGPVGEWAPVPLAKYFPGGADGGDFGFYGGRLHSLGNDLYVFSRFGAAAKLTGPATCP